MFISRPIFCMKNLWTRTKRPIAICATLSALGSLGYLCKKCESETARAGAAGCFAALGVELLCHPIDTINMKSKASHGHAPEKLRISQVLKPRYIGSLFRGAGYVFSGYPPFLYLYYSMYHVFKDWNL